MIATDNTLGNAVGSWLEERVLMGEREGAGGEAELTALVEEHGRLLFRVAYGVLRSRAEAEDVVQDALVRVLERRGRLAEVREMRVWLVKIVWNLAVDRRRRIRPDQMDAGFAEGLAAKSVAADDALGEARRVAGMLAVIEKLPKLERQVLLLSGVEELGAAEIAGVVGRSESAVRALLWRARARLKERMYVVERKGGWG